MKNRAVVAGGGLAGCLHSPEPNGGGARGLLPHVRRSIGASRVGGGPGQRRAGAPTRGFTCPCRHRRHHRRLAAFGAGEQGWVGLARAFAKRARPLATHPFQAARARPHAERSAVQHPATHPGCRCRPCRRRPCRRRRWTGPAGRRAAPPARRRRRRPSRPSPGCPQSRRWRLRSDGQMDAIGAGRAAGEQAGTVRGCAGARAAGALRRGARRVSGRRRLACARRHVGARGRGGGGQRAGAAHPSPSGRRPGCRRPCTPGRRPPSQS